MAFYKARGNFFGWILFRLDPNIPFIHFAECPGQPNISPDIVYGKWKAGNNLYELNVNPKVSQMKRKTNSNRREQIEVIPCSLRIGEDRVPSRNIRIFFKRKYNDGMETCKFWISGRFFVVSPGCHSVWWLDRGSDSINLVDIKQAPGEFLYAIPEIHSAVFSLSFFFRYFPIVAMLNVFGSVPRILDSAYHDILTFRGSSISWLCVLISLMKGAFPTREDSIDRRDRNPNRAGYSNNESQFGESVRPPRDVPKLWNPLPMGVYRHVHLPIFVDSIEGEERGK